MIKRLCGVMLPGWFMAILFVFLFELTVLSQSNVGQITGRVTSLDSNESVPFAVVFLSDNQYNTVADSLGYYELTNVNVGDYRLTVQNIGFDTYQANVTVKSNNPIQNIVLSKQAIGLSEVDVVAKSNVTKIKEQPYNVSVIDIKPLQAKNLDMGQALGTSTGIRIREEGGVGSGFSFSLNGFSGKQVKFFLDGIPMDNFGPSMGVNNIPANLAERIEIYKGVLPVSLGADALGGAINIITRKDLNYLDASYTTGSFNTHKASFNTAVTDKRGITFRSNLFYNYSDNNYKVFVPILNLQTNQKGGSQWVERFHDAYRSAGFKAEAGLTNKSFADYLLFGMLVSANDKEIQNGVTMESVYGRITSYSYSLIPSLRYHKKNILTPGLNFTLGVTYNYSVFNYTDTVPVRFNWLGERIEKTSTTGGEYLRSQLTDTDKEWIVHSNLEYRLSKSQLLSANYVLSSVGRQTIDKEDPANVENKIPQSIDKHIVGVGYNITYPKWNFSLLGKLYSMQGTSYEYINQFTDAEELSKFTTNYLKGGFGSAFTWFAFDNFQAKVSFERTFRLPDGTEMFGNGLFTVRNPDLQPEKSDNYNLGISYNMHLGRNHAFDMEAGLIYRDTKDYIQKELQDPSTQYINLGNVLTTGYEGIVRYRWKKVLRASANITFQDIVDNMQYVITTGYVGAGKSKNLTYRDRLPNIPYLFGYADLGVTIPKVAGVNNELSFDYGLNYVNEYYLSWSSLGAKSSKSVIPTQFSHTASLGYAINKQKYNITLECTNLTDEKVYDNYMLQKPGRAFYLKLRYNL